MILKVNDALINLANMTTALIKPDRARFSFIVRSDSIIGHQLSTEVFEGEEAAAIYSYVNGNVSPAVIDTPFVDVMAHYRTAQQRATNPSAR